METMGKKRCLGRAADQPPGFVLDTVRHLFPLVVPFNSTAAGQLVGRDFL